MVFFGSLIGTGASVYGVYWATHKSINVEKEKEKKLIKNSYKLLKTILDDKKYRYDVLLKDFRVLCSLAPVPHVQNQDYFSEKEYERLLIATSSLKTEVEYPNIIGIFNLFEEFNRIVMNLKCLQDEKKKFLETLSVKITEDENTYIVSEGENSEIEKKAGNFLKSLLYDKEVLNSTSLMKIEGIEGRFNEFKLELSQKYNKDLSSVLRRIFFNEMLLISQKEIDYKNYKTLYVVFIESIKINSEEVDIFIIEKLKRSIVEVANFEINIIPQIFQELERIIKDNDN